MLDDLVSVIETLKQRIHDHGTSLRANETRTRMAMIDPMLRALGWDPADPSVVTPEYDVSGRWADYALLGTDGKPAATLEAKKLGESLGTHRMQMLNYSNAAGIAYAGLTDGNHWELYEVFAQKPLEERRVLQLSIVDTPAHQCALQLLLLWRPNLASGRPILASEPISANNTASAEPQETAAPSPAPFAPAALPTSGDGWVPLSEFNPPTGTNPPSSIRFSDGNNIAIRSWKEIPTAVARWLHARRMLTVGNLPVASGKRGMAANSVPLHRDGSSMVTHETIGDDEIFINVHLSARASRENAKKILEHCGVDPRDVYLQTG